MPDINMSGVKAITLNNQDVLKIEDTNGNVLWQKSTSPYKVMEYLVYSGNEYVDTNSVQTHNRRRTAKFVFSGHGNGSYSRVFASYTNAVATTARRYFMGAINDSNQCSVLVGGTTSNQYTISLNTEYTIESFVSNNTSNTTATFVLKNSAGSTLINTTVSAGNSVALSPLKKYLGAQYNNDGGMTGPMIGKIYYYQEFTGNSSSYTNRLYNFVPVQRKSDNRCGMYDVDHNVFWPINGTVTTTGAAGPIVDDNGWVPEVYSNYTLTSTYGSITVPTSDALKTMLSNYVHGTYSTDHILIDNITYSFSFKSGVGDGYPIVYTKWRLLQDGVVIDSGDITAWSSTVTKTYTNLKSGTLQFQYSDTGSNWFNPSDSSRLYVYSAKISTLNYKVQLT